MNSVIVTSWLPFFREAGIPLPLAENYGALFEDNRITKEMMLDLNKEILQDIGITVIGDIILILKHAKKTHQMELKTKSTSSTGIKKSTVAIAPISVSLPVEAVDNKQSPPRKEIVLSPPSPPPPPPEPEVQYTTAAYENEQKVLKGFEVGKLRSDVLSVKSERPSVVIHEEYTTSTYEAKMMKRASAQPPPPPFKVMKTQSSPIEKGHDRIVILPSSIAAGGDGIERSKRFLEAAGCFRSGPGEPVSTQKQSVFSRLELPTNRRSYPPISNVKSRLGRRPVSPTSSPSLKSTKLYSDGGGEEVNTIHSRLGPKQEMVPVGDDICTPTMVADTFSKHSDVHTRLQRKGLTVLPTKGPLGKRLGDHAVFSRLW